MSAPAAWWRNPWRRPWGLALVTFVYLAWSLLPVLVAVLFSFNAGRSRVTWQGFSMRWYYGDPLRSVWHDASLHTALTHTLLAGGARHRDHGPARASPWRSASTAGGAGSRRARTSR